MKSLFTTLFFFHLLSCGVNKPQQGQVSEAKKSDAAPKSKNTLTSKELCSNAGKEYEIVEKVGCIKTEKSSENANTNKQTPIANYQKPLTNEPEQTPSKSLAEKVCDFKEDHIFKDGECQKIIDKLDVSKECEDLAGDYDSQQSLCKLSPLANEGSEEPNSNADQDSPQNTPLNDSNQTNTISGKVTGITQGFVTLILNEKETLIAQNGDFEFSSIFKKDQRYKIEVQTNPQGHECILENFIGIIDDASINDVEVICSYALDSIRIGGTVTGMPASHSITVTSNNAEVKKITQNGRFELEKPFADGAIVSLTVQIDSPAYTCHTSENVFTTNQDNSNALNINCFKNFLFSQLHGEYSKLYMYQGKGKNPVLIANQVHHEPFKFLDRRSPHSHQHATKSKLFFTAHSGDVTFKLFSYDGQTVDALTDSVFGSSPQFLSSYEEHVIYSALYQNGRDLLRSNGTTDGSSSIYLLRDNASHQVNPIYSLINNKVYFAGSEGKLWSTDLATNSTVKISDEQDSFSQVRGITSDGQMIYFFASNLNKGRELWVREFNGASAKALTDLYTGFNSSIPGEQGRIIPFKGKAYTLATENGSELKLISVNPKTGDIESTSNTLVQNNHVTLSKYTEKYTNFIATESHLYMVLYTQENGVELWQTQGTLATTKIVQELALGSGSTDFGKLILHEQNLYFCAKPQGLHPALYKLDSGLETITKIHDLGSQPTSLCEANGGGFISGNEFIFATVTADKQSQYWRSAGSSSSTHLLNLDTSP